MNLKLQIAVLVLGAVFAIAGIVLSTRKHDRSKNTIKALGMEFQVSGSALVFFAMGCVLILAALGLGGGDSSVSGDRRGGETNAVLPSETGSNRISPSEPCRVAGRVYNADTPGVDAGLSQVDLAYIPNTPANASAISMATTDPKGRFQFDCSHIKPEEFPVRLQMKYKWPGGSQIIQSENQITIAGNTEMSLYLSPRQITNWNKINKAVLRIPTSELLRKSVSVTPVVNPRTLLVRTN